MQLSNFRFFVHKKKDTTLREVAVPVDYDRNLRLHDGLCLGREAQSTYSRREEVLNACTTCRNFSPLISHLYFILLFVVVVVLQN